MRSTKPVTSWADIRRPYHLFDRASVQVPKRLSDQLIFVAVWQRRSEYHLYELRRGAIAVFLDVMHHHLRSNKKQIRAWHPPSCASGDACGPPPLSLCWGATGRQSRSDGRTTSSRDSYDERNLMPANCPYWKASRCVTPIEGDTGPCTCSASDFKAKCSVYQLTAAQLSGKSTIDAMRDAGVLSPFGSHVAVGSRPTPRSQGNAGLEEGAAGAIAWLLTLPAALVVIWWPLRYYSTWRKIVLSIIALVAAIIVGVVVETIWQKRSSSRN